MPPTHQVQYTFTKKITKKVNTENKNGTKWPTDSDEDDNLF